jgi:hypothetical protein
MEQKNVSVPACVGVKETLVLAPPPSVPEATTPLIVNVCGKEPEFWTITVTVWPTLTEKAFGA